MKTMLGLALVMLAAAFPAAGPHPFARAKVGDWIEYQFDYELDGKPLAVRGDPVTAQVRMQVKAREKNTLKIEYIILNVPPDIPMPESLGTIRLDKPLEYPAFEEEKEGYQREGVQVKSSIVARGKATLNLQGKKYECTWMRRKGAFIRPMGQEEFESTVWYCDAIPSNGMVKAVISTGTTRVSQTMTRYGRASDKK